MNTNTVDLTTIRGAFAFLNSLDHNVYVLLRPNHVRNSVARYVVDAVERITGQPVSAWIERWGGECVWDIGSLTWELRAHLHQRLFQRLASRRWPLRLMINGEPVGYGLGVDHAVLIYDPAENGGLAWFVSALMVACGDSKLLATKLLVRHTEACPDDVVEYMAALLNTGFGTVWPNGLRVEFDPNHFGLDLELDLTNDAAWRLVDYILNYQKTNSQ